MNKKYIIIIAIFALVLLLCGCSKSDKSIAQEIADRDLSFSQYNLDLSDYKITKRQTNNADKTDFVWLTIEGENNVFSYKASYIATYIKYNDGWQLEDYKIQDSSFSAQSEPTFEAIKNNLSKEYTNLEITNTKGIFTSNEVKYTLTGQISENYIDKECSIVVDYKFTPEEGWYEINEEENVISSKYNIVGEWLFEDDEHLYYIHVSDIEKNKLNLKYNFVNKTITEEDGYWQLRYDDYISCELISNDSDTYYIDVDWNKSKVNVCFADEDYIWFCNNIETVHGEKSGFFVNGYFLERISESDKDSNYPQELNEAIKTYTADYSKIPTDVFDTRIIESVELLDKKYEEIKDDLVATGVQQMYSLGKVKFLDNQAYFYMWLLPENGQRPGALELSATGYSCDELREYFKNELKWTLYEESVSGFMTIIPHTDLSVTVFEEVFSAKVTIRKLSY